MKFETAVKKIEAGLGDRVGDEQGIESLFEKTDVSSRPQVIAEAGNGYAPNTNYISWQNTENDGIANLFSVINNTKGRLYGWSSAELALRNQLPPPKFERYRGDHVIVFADGKNLLKKLQEIAVRAENSTSEIPLPMNPQMRYTTFRAVSDNDNYNHIYATVGDDNASFTPILEDDNGVRHEIDPYGAFATMLCTMVKQSESGMAWNTQEIIDLDEKTYRGYLSNNDNFRVLREGFYQSVHEVALQSGESGNPNSEIETIANNIKNVENGEALADALAGCPTSYVTTGLYKTGVYQKLTFTAGGHRDRRAQLGMNTLSYPQKPDYLINVFFEMVGKLKVSDNNFRIEDRIGYIPSSDVNLEYLSKLYKQDNVLGMQYSGWNRQLNKFSKFMDGIKVADFNVMQA